MPARSLHLLDRQADSLFLTFPPSSMLRKGQEGHVRAERDLLATAATSTRWTVRLAYSFQDVDHLYLVMTFMSGGGESEGERRVPSRR